MKNMCWYLANGNIMLINGKFYKIMCSFVLNNKIILLEKLEAIDRDLLLFLNGLHTPLLDGAMWYISTIVLWIPLFLFFFFYAFRKGNWLLLLIVFFGIAFCILLADRISVEAFKEVFQRYRPSHNLEIQSQIHSVVRSNGEPYLGGKYGFVSSHAANFFAITTFLVLIFNRFSKAWYWLFLWAAIIGYSRIYLGVHYPSDVIVGSLLGLLIGYVVAVIAKKIMRKYGNF